MKKTVYAIWGREQQGKSATVIKLAQLILQDYPDADKDRAVIDFSKDITVIITIGDMKIGIESQGDPGSRIFKSLEYFVDQQCTIIICCTRSSRSTVDIVNELHSKHGYDNVWLTNYRSNEKNQERLNALSAKHIWELIKGEMGEIE